MAKIYVGSANNLLDHGSAAEIAKILVGLVDNQDDITFTQDANGAYFQVSDEILDAFVKATEEGPKRKPGRPRKSAEPEAEQQE